MSNLMQRVLVALIGIPIVIYIVMAKPFGLLGLVVIAALLAVHEFYNLAKAKGFVPQIGIGMAMTALIVLSFAQFRMRVHLETTDIITLIMIGGFLATLTAELFKGYPNPFVQVCVTIAGAVYLGFGAGAVFGVHEYFYLHAAAARLDTLPAATSSEAGYFTIVLLASIWICDSAAYFVGRAFGKHKIAVKVSPNKSWEGGIAGLIAAIATWVIAVSTIEALAPVQMSTAVVMGLISGVLGQVGDFAESMLKRDVGVKDSSALIPGHGGVLDRLDSILFVFPSAFLYLHLFGA
jgi:phosphatidate cytidylyltransferase